MPQKKAESVLEGSYKAIEGNVCTKVNCLQGKTNSLATENVEGDLTTWLIRESNMKAIDSKSHFMR